MGFIDDIKDKTGNFEEMKQRFEELKGKEESGDIDDKGKQELQKLREHLDKKG